MRKLLILIPLRLLDFRSPKQLDAWGTVEEVAVSSLGFFAKLSKIADVNSLLLPGSRAIANSLQVSGLLSIESKKLGLGGDEDALWITLDKDVKIEDEKTVIILYFHGGGYCIGSANMYASAFREWLRQMRLQGLTAGILSIEYPLAPKYKFPIALEWAVKSYDAVTGLGVSPSRMIVAGDSAGAGLAIRCCIHGYECEKRKPGSTHIAGLVLISPWVNHSCKSGSHLVNSSYDFISGSSVEHTEAEKVMNSFSEAYCEDIELALTDPSISLLHLPSFSALPPTMITLGSKEVFHDDVALFSAKAKRDNVPVSTYLGKDMPHVWPMLWPIFKEEGRATLQAMAEFCAKRVALRKKIRVTDKWSEKVSTSLSKRNLTNLNLAGLA